MPPLRLAKPGQHIQGQGSKEYHRPIQQELPDTTTSYGIRARNKAAIALEAARRGFACQIGQVYRAQAECHRKDSPGYITELDLID